MKTGVIRGAMASAALLALAACAVTEPAVRLEERLDEATGVTLTTLDRPLEFFCPLPEKGLEAASFADLGLAEANRMGTRSYYLWFSLLWGRLAADRMELPKFSTLVLDLGTESLSFQAAERAPAPVRMRLYAPAADWSEEFAFALTTDQVRAIAHSSVPTLRVVTESGEAFAFTLWKPPTETLRMFSDELLDGIVAPR
jgi:hypothetical protein